MGRSLCFEWYGDHRDLHVLTHSCPTRRASDLEPGYDEALAAAKLHRGRGSAPPEAGHEIALHPDAIGIIQFADLRRKLQDDTLVGKHLRGDVQPHAELAIFDRDRAIGDRKSTRLNSSH